jgi:DNA-binding HxlR family transcriptional regulator
LIRIALLLDNAIGQEFFATHFMVTQLLSGKNGPGAVRKRALQSRDAIELLSDKWRIGILHLLTAGPLRTGEIQRALAEVSAKVLTQTLRGMERDGLIERNVFSVMPPRVEYQLTAMGQSVIKPLAELCRWAKIHVAERDAARQRFEHANGKRAGPRNSRGSS